MTPTDADLILVTHGHFDHASSAADIAKASIVEGGCKIGCVFELGQFYNKFRDYPMDKIVGCNKSGTVDLDWVTFTCVNADHSSSCGFENGNLQDGGAPVGFVIRPPGTGVSIYHAGDTGVFSDMGLINELYKPTHLCLPIGGHFTMGPYEAAFAVCRFFTRAHTVIPMHFLTFPLLKGNVDQFIAEVQKNPERREVRVLDSYKEIMGTWVDLEKNAYKEPSLFD